jgi:hypothetical protein
MVRIKLVVSVAGAACVAATILSSNALAGKAKVYPSFREVGTRTLLEAGDPLTFKSSAVVIATTEGNITCEVGVLKGTLQNNGLKTDNFVVNNTTFHAAGGGPCPSTTPLGPAKITAEPPKGGWPGVAKIRGKASVIGPLVLTAKFEPPSATITCTFSATKAKATFVPDGTPIQVHVSAKFKRSAVVPGCPKSAALSGTFALTSRGNEVAMS